MRQNVLHAGRVDTLCWPVHSIVKTGALKFVRRQALFGELRMERSVLSFEVERILGADLRGVNSKSDRVLPLIRAIDLKASVGAGLFRTETFLGPTQKSSPANFFGV